LGLFVVACPIRVPQIAIELLGKVSNEGRSTSGDTPATCADKLDADREKDG
jgi:hypothetical protein